MPILPVGIGTNLDIDETSTREGLPVMYVNCYADRSQSVRRNPPIRSFSTPPVDSIDQIYESLLLGLVLAFGSGLIYKLENDGTYTELTGGELSPGVPVAVCENGTHVFFAANSKIHKTDGVTVEVLGVDSPQGVTSLVFFGSFLCANGAPGAGDYIAGDTHISDDKENGYVTWEVFENEYKADDLKSLVVLNNFLFAIGSESIQTNYISGTAANPIASNQAGTKDFGTPARYSVACDEEAIYLLTVAGEGRKILRMRGGVEIDPIGIPLGIPLEEIEQVDDAKGWITGFRGQNFYVLTFPTANVTIDGMFFPSITFAYHIQDKSWSIWGKWDDVAARFESHRINSFLYVQRWGKRLMGGRDGIVYEVYENTDVDYDAEPVYLHRWRDGGKKEWTQGRVIEIGEAGEYEGMKVIRGCGTYRSRQHQIEYTDRSEAGNIFKMLVRTGNISYGSLSKVKRPVAYHHSIKAGTNDFIINQIEEEF
jgi:hypothetical protein